MELITGASGYVGGRLLRRLAAEGRSLRALARRPERVEALAGVEVVRADLLSGEGLEAALDGVSTAYYLVHSMEPASDGGFAARDRRAAEAFGRVAAAASRRRDGARPTSARGSRWRRSCSRPCRARPRCAPRS
jgi:uncharacterized protein YbjT (DUF2867 family)